MKTCPRCRSSIDERATRCPQCAADFNSGEMSAGFAESRRMYAMKLVAVLFVIALIVMWLNDGGVERLAEMTSK